jgi:AraC-like DNA-binding protein
MSCQRASFILERFSFNRSLTWRVWLIMGGRLSKIEEWELLAREADFRPAKMAALCCISSRQLERFFEQQFSDTPGQWLRKLQCRLAKELISQGYSNKATAAELKFASESHFCREFKKQYGATPQAFAPGWNVGFRQECRDQTMGRV